MALTVEADLSLLRLQLLMQERLAINSAKRPKRYVPPEPAPVEGNGAGGNRRPIYNAYVTASDGELIRLDKITGENPQDVMDRADKKHPLKTLTVSQTDY